MDIATSLYTGKLVHLGPIDHEKDPEVESRWTHDPVFMRMMYTDPMRPLSVIQLKKKYEMLEKEIVEDKNLFHFRIRATADERLLGFGELHFVSWPNGSGYIRLGIGSSEDRHKGYGYEALCLLLRYAFSELNLYRLTAIIPEYNEPARALFMKVGFQVEGRQRGMLLREGKRWDVVFMGSLREEWLAEQTTMEYGRRTMDGRLWSII